MKPRCIMLLSTKSAGSSACQRLLAQLADVNTARFTRHFESETLFWTKAASILRLPQDPMLDSEVPLRADEARHELETFARLNVPGYQPPIDDLEFIFDAWARLCEAHRPVFLEKSPHHLFQWSALTLMEEWVERSETVASHFIGLVRNPMDVAYSAWRRWATPPERFQYEWLQSYRNLLRLKERQGDRLTIVRYEDIVKDLTSLEPIVNFLGARRGALDERTLNSQSVAKWKLDDSYGFVLAPEVHSLARDFGYAEESLAGARRTVWPALRLLRRPWHRASRSLRSAGRWVRSESRK